MPDEHIIREKMLNSRCEHYVAFSIGEQQDANGNVVCLLGNCVKCGSTISLTGYVKIVRREWQEVYIKGDL